MSRRDSREKGRVVVLVGLADFDERNMTVRPARSEIRDEDILRVRRKCIRDIEKTQSTVLGKLITEFLATRS